MKKRKPTQKPTSTFDIIRQKSPTLHEHKTRSMAIAVGRTRRMLISPVRKIKLPQFRPCNTHSNGISHMQIDATVSELQWLKYSVVDS